MTIYLSATLPLSELTTCFEIFSALPVNLSQIEISDGENDPKFPITFKQIIEKKDAPIDLKGGYFLHAEDACYNIKISKNLSFFIECVSDKVAQILMNRFAGFKTLYAYACEFDERKHQNRVVVKKSYGIHEQWVGRDFTKYLPGIYWLNLVPGSLLERHGIDVQSIESVSILFEKSEDDKYLFQLYPESGDWKSHTKSIDSWRLNTSGVFFKKDAQTALEEASTFLESSDATRDWK